MSRNCTGNRVLLYATATGTALRRVLAAAFPCPGHCPVSVLGLQSNERRNSSHSWPSVFQSTRLKFLANLPRCCGAFENFKMVLGRTASAASLLPGKQLGTWTEQSGGGGQKQWTGRQGPVGQEALVWAWVMPLFCTRSRFRHLPVRRVLGSRSKLRPWKATAG